MLTVRKEQIQDDIGKLTSEHPANYDDDYYYYCVHIYILKCLTMTLLLLLLSYYLTFALVTMDKLSVLLFKLGPFLS